jgi:hypothetical protein
MVIGYASSIELLAVPFVSPRTRHVLQIWHAGPADKVFFDGRYYTLCPFKSGTRDQLAARRATEGCCSVWRPTVLTRRALGEGSVGAGENKPA